MFIAKKIQDVIEEALSKAKKDNISGKAVTPFLLDRVRENTAGESLASSKYFHFYVIISLKIWPNSSLFLHLS